MTRGWLFVGREEILGCDVNERVLREADDSMWDTAWQAYWVRADTPLDTWLRLQGVIYRQVVRDQGLDHENLP